MKEITWNRENSELSVKGSQLKNLRLSTVNTYLRRKSPSQMMLEQQLYLVRPPQQMLQKNDTKIKSLDVLAEKIKKK